MSEPRSFPLRDLAKPGRYGAATKTPGVNLSISHPTTLVTVIARKGKSKSVREQLARMRSVTVMDAGAEQWFAQGASATGLKAKMGNTASVIDQSHGRVIICISGPKCRAVLAKGTPVDLDPSVFPIGKSAMTTMAHVGVLLTRVGHDEFTIGVFRGFSESFWEWLTGASGEFGYQVS